MKTILKICLITIKQNRFFSAGLFVIFIFATAISFVGVNFAPSCEKSINQYLDKYNLADAWYVTAPLPSSLQTDLLNIKDVKHVDLRFSLDMNASTPDGSIYSFRIFRYDENSWLKQAVTDSLEGKDDGAVIYDAFQNSNPLKLGDELIFKTSAGEKRIPVTAFAYNPETSTTSYNEWSYCENSQFGYMYLPRKTYDEIFGTNGMTNSWVVYFDDTITPDRRGQALQEIRDIFGEHILSAAEKDDYVKGIREGQKTLDTISRFIPFIAYFIAIVFSLLLLWQVIDNQKKTIGLLRAIGYTTKQTASIYILYAILIAAFSVLIGVASGYICLHLCVDKYNAANRIAEKSIEIRYASVILLCALTLICTAFICVFCAVKISSVDPSKNYGGMKDSAAIPPKIIRKLRINVFFKISLASLLRNKRRLILSSVCIAVCIFFMSMLLEVADSSTLPTREVFGGRYGYTLLVHNTDDLFFHEVQTIDGVEKAEPVLTFSADMTTGGSVKRVILSGIAPDSELFVLKNASGSRITAGDGIIIEEMFAETNQITAGDTVTVSGKEFKVTAIARELVYPVMFVSLDTAKSLADHQPTDIALLLRDGADIKKVKQKICELNENAVIIEQAKQKQYLTIIYSPIEFILHLFLFFVFDIGTFIIFNMSVINFREKVTDYASLRSLGTPFPYFGIMFFIENIIQFLIAILIAWPVSYFGNGFLLKAMSSTAQQFVMVRFTKYLLISFLISFGYVLTGVLVSLFNVKKMNFLQWLNRAE